MSNTLYRRSLIVLGVGCLLCAGGDRSRAQVIYNQASTPQQAAAEGMSSIISAQGDYNLSTSQAAINMTQAQHNEIQNRQQWTDAYFQMREANKAYRTKERGPNLSPEQLVRYAQMGKPRPLTPSEFDRSEGRILWPSVLQIDDYTAQREKLDEVFAKRAQKGSIGYEEQLEIRSTTDAMLDQLKGQISSVPPALYAAARSFLKSLAYEGLKAS